MMVQISGLGVFTNNEGIESVNWETKTKNLLIAAYWHSIYLH